MLIKDRAYRRLFQMDHLVSFRVTVKETDLFIQAGRPLEDVAREAILKHRGYLESWITRDPDFLTALSPRTISGPCPKIVREMADAGEKAGVGPMAAVAGAIAEQVGWDLLDHSDETIVENGGDLFLKLKGRFTAGIFAGKSQLSLKVGIEIDTGGKPIAVCTSSGTIGHSMSMGKADAVCVVSASCPLADAAATAIGNRVQAASDVQNAIDFGNQIPGIKGIVVIVGDRIGMWGDIRVVPFKEKRG